MAKKFDLDAMLAAGELTQAQYDQHILRRQRGAAARERATNGTSAGGFHRNEGSRVKAAKVTEETLLMWARDLRAIQAVLETDDAEPSADDATKLQTIAEAMEHFVNPFRARKDEFEDLADALTLEKAQADVEFAQAAQKLRVAQRKDGLESDAARKAGELVKKAVEKQTLIADQLREARMNLSKAGR